MNSNSRPSCVLTGEQSLLVQCGEALLADGWTVDCVFTENSQLMRWARGRGITTAAAAEILADTFFKLDFDYLFSIGNLTVLPEAVIAAPGCEAINFHDGPLPDMPGLNVPNWAIIEGRAFHAITWHVMTPAVDRGDILAQIDFPIDPGDTALALNAKCFEAGLNAFRTLIAAICDGSIERRSQGAGEGSYYGRDMLLPNGGVVRWSEPAERISALARATNFGPYENPLGLPYVWLGDRFVTLGEVSGTGDLELKLNPGSCRVDNNRLLVGTGSSALSIEGLREMNGAPLELSTLASITALPPRELTEAELATLLAASRAESGWINLRAAYAPLDLVWLFHGADQAFEPCRSSLEVPAQFADEFSTDEMTAALALTVLRLSGESSGLVAVLDAALESLPLVEPFRPMLIALQEDESVEAFTDRVARELDSLQNEGPLLQDQGLRTTLELSSTPTVAIGTLASQGATDDFDIHIWIDAEAEVAKIETCFNRAISTRRLAQYEEALKRVMHEVAARSVTSAASVDIVSAADRSLMLDKWNTTKTSIREECIQHAFLRAAAEHPETAAVLCQGKELSFGELSERAQTLAQHLQSLGIGCDDRVGICLERGEELVIAVLGVLMSGAAYVPLDPDYPAVRLRHIIDDAEPSLTLVSDTTRQRLEATNVPLLAWEDASRSGEPRSPHDESMPEHLAYVIYTSGSTGAPKGVMVEHRNVANFFAAMDEAVPLVEAPRWLAVTSLSFDISVLELLWTLTRGVGVVLYTGADRTGEAQAITATPRTSNAPIDFSLFYFASDEGERQNDQGKDGQNGANKYRLLIEGAKFADAHGFAAVWTPERHFHAFGGLYPNPAVAGAAIATITENIHIRAGSCVLPLHDPLRIAEEWALVDNLSNGRVGISFASGWQPNDFVIAPDNYENRHQVMTDGIETVRALWRGESVRRVNPLGKEIELSTLPRPVQDEVPFWVTAAGNPATFSAAGELGANLLTHLLGQSTQELAEKIEAYHEAWREAGHAGSGHVTLMLHTFVGDDEDEVKSHVHGPLKEYLRSSVGLIHKVADTFPAFKKNQRGDGGPIDFDALSSDDMEALLEFAFERYYSESGMFGTPARCAQMVDSLKGIGVNEIACLIDFGVPSELVFAHLPGIAEVKRLSEPRVALPAGSVAELIESHKVTHLQCTPSQAQMLLTDPDNHPALASLRGWLIGGEALPLALAQGVRAVATGTVMNMYGPTETTIWSAVWPLPDSPQTVLIGTPIANTRCYVLDEALQLRPPGAPGELFIGGQGVTRGYHGNEDLTESRFLADPFGEAGERMYRTGDLVSWVDGELQFHGRTDDQVKVRGYRIELGDIEAALNAFDGPQQAVVAIKRDTAGEPIIVAYVRMPPASGLDEVALRRHLNRQLPSFMVPQVFIEIDEVPLTANGKVDRHALPGFNAGRRGGRGAYVAPSTEMEKALASVWSDVLSIEQVSAQDTFFELGGDSLSAVRVAIQVRDKIGEQIPLETLLRATLEQSARSLELTRESRAASPKRGGDRQERKVGLLTRLTKRKP